MIMTKAIKWPYWNDDAYDHANDGNANNMDGVYDDRKYIDCNNNNENNCNDKDNHNDSIDDNNDNNDDSCDNISILLSLLLLSL